MRAALIVLLVAMGMEAAPAAACPIDPIEGAAVIAAPRTGPNPTVILDVGLAREPWHVEVSGVRGDGSPRATLEAQVRRIPGTTLALVDIPQATGYADLWLTDDRDWRSSHLFVSIDGAPDDYFVGWGDRVWRTPPILEPTAPAWRTPLLAGGVTMTVVLMGLGVWAALRGRRAVAV